MLIYTKYFTHPSQIRFLFVLPNHNNKSIGREIYFMYANLCLVALKRGPAYDTFYTCSHAIWEGQTSQRQEWASQVGVMHIGGVTGEGLEWPRWPEHYQRHWGHRSGSSCAPEQKEPRSSWESRDCPEHRAAEVAWTVGGWVHSDLWHTTEPVSLLRQEYGASFVRMLWASFVC